MLQFADCASTTFVREVKLSKLSFHASARLSRKSLQLVRVVKRVFRYGGEVLLHLGRELPINVKLRAYASAQARAT